MRTVEFRWTVQAVGVNDETPPILEFDGDRNALIDPAARSPIAGIPPAGVACHFPDLIEARFGHSETLARLPSLGVLKKVTFHGEPLAVFYPGQGASLAAVTYERVLAAGCHTVVACGGAGSLVPSLELGHVVVVDSAVRDEGTSYHYLPPSREVRSDNAVVETLRELAQEASLSHTVGKVWTTDGFFRETPGKVAKRRNEGCIVVDAEASAMLAVAQFRGETFGQLLYAADDLSGSTWHDRNWRLAHDARAALFDLAATAALRLAGPAAANAIQ